MLWEHAYLNVSFSFTCSVYSRIWGKNVGRSVAHIMSVFDDEVQR
jgi:hypothetical protein